MNAVESFHTELEAMLRVRPGSSPSASIYAELVFRQKVQILDALCPAVRVAFESSGGDFRALVADFADLHPPSAWEPNAFAAPFAEFLAQRRQALGPERVPPYLEELADLAFVSDRVMRPDFDTTVGLDATLFVRRYTHAVVPFAAAVRRRRPGSEPPALPLARPNTVVVCRLRTTEALHAFEASAHDVFAIARAAGTQGFAGPEVDGAEAILRRVGVLP